MVSFTRKHRLLSEYARVALGDKRSSLPGELVDVEAVTVTGRAHEVEGPEYPQWSRLLTDRHSVIPHF